MATPHPVPGIDPDRRLRPNARRILRVRIAEVHGYEDLITDPRNVTELHDTRIAFKRLRYLLEIFGPAFPDDLSPFLEEVRGMQDLLGDIHDRDVQIPALEAHLRTLEDGDADQRPGVRTLIARSRAERDALYDRFLSEWARLRADRFRGRLEAALGIG